LEKTPPAGRVRRPRGTARRSTHTLRLRVSATLVALTVLAVLLVPPLVQLDQQSVDLGAKLLPPSWDHPFGPDDVVRDQRLGGGYGRRVAVVGGLVAALTASVLGTAVGATAGAHGGWADRIAMRVVAPVASVPHLLLGIFIVAMFRPGVWPGAVS